MNESEFAVFEKSTKAMVRRISAENTWLRHTMMEMEQRVGAMSVQITQLEAKARNLKKQLNPIPVKTPTKSRSKK